MKIIELQLAPKNRRGKFLKNGVKLEPHEEDTAKFLVNYGFTIDVMRPVNTPKVRPRGLNHGVALNAYIIVKRYGKIKWFVV